MTEPARWHSRTDSLLTHLFVGVAKLVLQNGLAVRQGLHLVGDGIERLDQGLGEELVIHAMVGNGHDVSAYVTDFMVSDGGRQRTLVKEGAMVSEKFFFFGFLE